MQELKALKPFRIGGQWLAEGSDVPFVEGFDYEKAERKGFLEEVDGELVVNPARAGIQRAQLVTDGSEEQEKLVLVNQNLSAELTQARAELKALTNAALLPEDALVRLEGVKGIGAELAKLAFKALTEPLVTAGAK